MILNGATYLGKKGVVLQKSRNDCGPSSLKMIFDFFKLDIKLDKIKKEILKENGSNMLDIKRFAEKKGLKVFAYKMGVDCLKKIKAPVILYLKNKHFLVMESISNLKIIILDPATGRLSMKLKCFSRIWTGKLLIFKKRKERKNR